MKRNRNYGWDEQNWDNYWGGEDSFVFSDVDQNSWNLCSNCDHCTLDRSGTTGICELDGHSVQYNTSCNYKIKKEFI